MPTSDIIQSISLISFTLAAFTFLQSFQNSTFSGIFEKFASILLIVGTIGATVAVPYAAEADGLRGSASLLLAATLGWLTIAGHIVWNLQMIGVFTSPLAALVLLLRIFGGHGPVAFIFTDSSMLLTFHVLMAILGEGLAVVASAVGALLLWQHRSLKNRQLRQVKSNVPAMDILTRVFHTALWLGFVFISLGLVSGALIKMTMVLPPGMNLEIKIIWAIVVWLLYLAILLAKNIFRFPALRLARMSFAGFLLLAVSYFGLIFFQPWGNL